jgi:hypothetical protein
MAEARGGANSASTAKAMRQSSPTMKLCQNLRQAPSYAFQHRVTPVDGLICH